MNVTDESFESEVLHADLPVLVYVWAPWCGPCKYATPIADALAEKYKDRLKVTKLNTDLSRKAAQALSTGPFPSLRAIPSFFLFKNGQFVDTIVGLVSKSVLVKLIENHL